MEDRLNIFTKQAVLEDLNEWEDSFKEKVEKEMRRNRVWFKKNWIKKKVKNNRKGGNEWTRKDVPSIKETSLNLE